MSCHPTLGGHAGRQTTQRTEHGWAILERCIAQTVPDDVGYRLESPTRKSIDLVQAAKVARVATETVASVVFVSWDTIRRPRTWSTAEQEPIRRRC